VKYFCSTVNHELTAAVVMTAGVLNKLDRKLSGSGQHRGQRE